MAQSTYIYRAQQCMSPRWNWDSPTPLAASECALPPGPKGEGAHSPAAKGVGESQLQGLEKRLALCLLCAKDPLFSTDGQNLGLTLDLFPQNPRFFLLFINAEQKYSTFSLADFFLQSLNFIGRSELS